MIETLHTFGSQARHSKVLAPCEGIFRTIEPFWQRAFSNLSRSTGFATHINDDVFKLTYQYASRYDRADHRIYEPVFYTPFAQAIRPGMTVFDIGAHVGFFTLAAAKRVGESGRVFAFEPAPATGRVLREHVRMNHWQDRVEVVDAVVTDANGAVTFYANGESMAASTARENVEDLNPERFSTPTAQLECPAYTLDSFCASHNVRPDVMKIDVEGAEVRVLRGAMGVLRSAPVTILCEVHTRQMMNCGSSREELDAILDAVDYTLEPLDEPNHLGTFHSVIRPRD